MGSKEDPIHKFALDWLKVSLPKAVVHHSPNESPSNQVKGWKLRNYRLGTVGGWPDIEVIHEGRILFLEVKAPKGRLTPTQQGVCEALLASGAHVHVVRSPEQIMAAVESFKIAVKGEVEGRTPEAKPAT